MKKILLILMSVLALTSLRAQNTTATPESLEFKELEYDFGTIPQGKPVYHSFTFRNASGAPVKLDGVAATCGCTTPEWTKEAIAPGANDIIKVGYNAATEGYFEKYITVTYNGNVTKQIKIKGKVWKAPSGSAPTNASVNFLKQQIQ